MLQVLKSSTGPMGASEQPETTCHLRPLPPALFSSSRLAFERLGASILAPSGTILAPWEHPGGPWEQQDGLEAVRHMIFMDLGMVLSPYFEGFSGLYRFVIQDLEDWGS